MFKKVDCMLLASGNGSRFRQHHPQSYSVAKSLESAGFWKIPTTIVLMLVFQYFSTIIFVSAALCSLCEHHCGGDCFGRNKLGISKLS